MDAAQTIILGANGQLGQALQARFPEAVAVGHTELDITDWASVQAYDWSKVRVIINAAAYTNVDGAETAEGRVDAWQINASALGSLAKVASEHDITLVHVSSEYVFDGSKSPHTEDEPFSPLGVYGQSKAAGDIAASTLPKHYILRTSWVIGDGKNFVRTMIGLADKSISPTVVADQIGRLTFTDTIVEAIDHLLSTNAAHGTYNVSNSGEPASWADITRAILEALGRTDLVVADTSTAEYFASKPNVAPRPLQSTLDLHKLEATGFVLRDWHDDLHSYIDNEMKKEQA